MSSQYLIYTVTIKHCYRWCLKQDIVTFKDDKSWISLRPNETNVYYQMYIIFIGQNHVNLNLSSAYLSVFNSLRPRDAYMRN